MNSAQEVNTTTIIAALMAVLFVAYTVLYEPFHFVAMVPPVVRILVEFSLLCILFFLWLSRTQPGCMPKSFLIFPVLVIWLLCAGETRTVNGPGEGWFPGFITKIIFLVLGVNALKYYPALVRVLARAWVLVWTFTGIQIVIAFLGFSLGIIHFSLQGDWRFALPEYYYNPIFGHLDFRGFKGIDLPQFSGFLMEPLFLGLFSGLNILTASYLVARKHQKWFKSLSCVTGLLSGSIAFLLFFSSFAVYKIVRKYSTHSRLISFLALAVVGFAVSWAILVSMGVGEASSFGSRALRISIALTALSHSTLQGLLFGTYNYSQSVGEKMSASCGFLSFLLQRGIILYVPVMCLFYRYARKDHFVLAYLVYYALLLEYFWWPAFVVYLVLYCCLSHAVQPVPREETC